MLDTLMICKSLNLVKQIDAKDDIYFIHSILEFRYPKLTDPIPYSPMK